jgi:putative protease
MEEKTAEKKLVGKVAHYFGKISVVVVELSDELKVGDRISIEGKTTNFSQPVDSMQIEHQQVESAGTGQAIGLKVVQRVKEGDLVFRVG